MEAAKIAVSAPTVATMAEVAGVNWNSGAERATMYTPAVTMVAAWIRAETGVGPSMASGSQTYSGNLRRFAGGADEQQQRDGAQHAEAGRFGGELAAAQRPRSTSVKRTVPSTESISSMPRMKPASPTRLTMNAFLPASPADFFWK